MGLRCLLGHDFDEPELRREREEDGSEVVTTVTEVKTCARCGETQVVSENTEVTTMKQLTDEAAAADPEPTKRDPGPARHDAEPTKRDPEPTRPNGEPTRRDPEPARRDPDPTGRDDAGRGGETPGPDDGDDAVIIDDGPGGDGDAADAPTDPETTDTEASEAGGSEPTASRGGDQAEPYPEAEATDEPADEERAETDDGVILDEEGGDGRDRGAWPDVDESDEDRGEPAPWPDHGGDDEGFSAEVGEAGAGDVEYVEAATQTASEAGRGAETGRGDETEREAGTGSTVGEGTDITRGDSPDIEAATSQVATEYYCPECEMTRAADGNSMRAGDICPECKRGYVDERPV